MNVFEKLVGQTLVAVVSEEGNSGLRFLDATLGIYAPSEGSPLNTVVGQFVVEVNHVEEKYLEIRFSGGSCIRVVLTPSVQTGPEAYSLHLSGGPIVVG
ncbi:hypothetical protein [Thiobacillus sp.]|uniref:hypothetical protein n=1 Tax=Thiobacillus sp. TaxID=924 RepID=UPI0017FB5769|nr:hypothetical protein [Thiobacillus sp.]MBC2729827.1 hypothetical protein [Thiobacillus sp.]MBC2738563.1 hypothetical protein [Thiobacillus sp.]MBC2761157.1 hypothetical protein [Thiobacillus sp.]